MLHLGYINGKNFWAQTQSWPGFGPKITIKLGKNALSFDEVVLFLELEPLLNKSPSKLSGGESQRVALGRALLCAENFMILDEPLSSLDPVLSNSLQGYLERIHSFAGLPFLYITHRPNEALRLTEEALLVAEGKNVLLGKTNEVLNQSQFLRSE